MDTMLLKNCRLIPELSQQGAPKLADIRVEEGRIAEISRAGDGKPADIVRDCRESSLVPGFIDCHTHLNYDYYNGVRPLDDYRLLHNSLKSARLYPRYGVTTIRDMGAPRRVAQQVRLLINDGLAKGPRIVTGGIILTPHRSETPPDRYCFVRTFSGTDEVTKAVREEIGGGADFVKMYATGDPPDLLPEELEQAVRVAHRYRRKVAVHAHDAQAISMAIDCGVDTIEHATKIRAEDVDRLKNRNDIHLVPTLAIFSPRVPLSGSSQKVKDSMLTPVLKAGIPCLRYAYEQGLKLGLGTDVQIEHFGEIYGLEFQMRMEELGMSAIDVLLQATRYSAEILGLENVTGTIREGLSADFVLIDGDPLEDPSLLAKRHGAVYVRGELWTG